MLKDPKTQDGTHGQIRGHIAEIFLQERVGKFPKTGSNASMRSSEPALASDVQDSIRCSRFFLQRFNRLLRGEDHKV